MEVFIVEVSPALVLRTVDGRAEYRVEGQRVFGRADFSWHPRSVLFLGATSQWSTWRAPTSWRTLVAPMVLF